MKWASLRTKSCYLIVPRTFETQVAVAEVISVAVSCFVFWYAAVKFDRISRKARQEAQSHFYDPL